MLRICLSIAVVVFGLASCDELSGHDDPRDNGNFSYDGSCGGIALDCGQFDYDWCQTVSGCMWTYGCFGSERDDCFSRASESACGVGSVAPYCDWEQREETCFAPAVSTCRLDDTTAACQDDPHGCTWGPTCAGSVPSCYDFPTPESCASQPGCEWR